MNLFNKAIYKNSLEHTEKGTHWGKHKYLYITETGRYVYPEDLKNSGGLNYSKQIEAQKRAEESRRGKKTAEEILNYKERPGVTGQTTMKTVMQDTARRKRINDQIRSAHQGEMSRNAEDMRKAKELSDMSGMKLSSTHKLNRLAKEQGTDSKEFKDNLKILSEGDKEQEKKMLDVINGNKTAKTSGTAAGSKSLSSNTSRNSIDIKSDAKTEEEKKTEETTTNDGSRYKNMSEETKAWLMKGGDKDKKEKKSGSGKKGGSGKKKGSSSGKSTKTEEQKQMGLTDDDLDKMEINTQATNRDEVLKNIALRVIRGDYGNGADRKAKLGSYYDEVQKRVNEIAREGNVQREGQSQQQTEQKEQTSTTQQAKTSNTSSKKEYKMEQYKKGDKDFDDSKYNDATRLGNTDFHAYKRDDGKYVILEEDMKWVVDEKPSTKMIKNLEAMDEYIDARRKNGTWEPKNASKEWDQLASIAINGGDLTEKAKAEKEKAKKSIKHYDLEEGLFLKHFGNKNSGRYPRGSGDRPYQHDGRHMRKNSTFRSRRSMTDDELMSAINRTKREVDLYKAERDNRSQGQRFVEDVITGIGKDVLKTAGRGALLYAGKQFATKVLNDPDLGDFIARGGPKKDKK